jgi:hypothetical protein
VQHWIFQNPIPSNGYVCAAYTQIYTAVQTCILRQDLLPNMGYRLRIAYADFNLIQAKEKAPATVDGGRCKAVAVKPGGSPGAGRSTTIG